MSSLLEEQNLNLEAQLVALYEEKQELGNPATLAEMVRNLEQQLISLYSDKAAGHNRLSPTLEALKSLEEQLASLYEEKTAYEKKMADMEHKFEDMKAKSKAIGAAFMEAAIFGQDA